VSPALLAEGIADPRDSFVAPIRQCDESAALTIFKNDAPHKCSRRQQADQFPGKSVTFFQSFCGVLSRIVILCALQTSWSFFILLQRGIAILDCEAAALPGRFLPELGRSSERPFFCAGLLDRGGVARRSWALSPHRSSRLATPQNPWRKRAPENRGSAKSGRIYSAASGS
jgi:hypothetical protein